jgi:hypothetical protein
MIQPVGSISYTLKHYVGRIDKLFLVKDGSYKVVKGKAGLIPVEPQSIENAIHLYNINLRPYVFDVGDIKVTKVDNKITIGINYIPNTEEIINKEDIISINESINENIAQKLRINFKIVSTDAPDIFNLHLLHNEKYILYGIANIQTLRCSKFIKKIFTNNCEKDIIVECKYSTKFNNWEPVELSEDKKSNTFSDLKNYISI